MPQDKRCRRGSAAAGGGMLVLWVTMRANAWLQAEWLPLLPETTAAGIGLMLQLLMLGLPLAVILRLLRSPAAVLCPLKRGRNGSILLIPAGLAALVAANLLTMLLQRFADTVPPDPAPLPENTAALLFTAVGATLLPAMLEELLFRGAVLHALRPAGEKTAIWLSTLLFMGAHGSLAQWLPALAAGLLLGTVTFYTGTLRWAIFIHLCNNIIAWGTTYFPSPVTSVFLPIGLLVLGLLSLPALLQRPRYIPAGGEPRSGFTAPLMLAALLLLGNALFPAL